jgi:hypothetical protein
VGEEQRASDKQQSASREQATLPVLTARRLFSVLLFVGFVGR